MTGLPENQSKTLLVGFVNRGKALADAIGDLQADYADMCREAKGAGFDGTKIREVVAWLRRVDKHGRAAMDDAEAVFDLYRSVVDAPPGSIDDMMTEARDKALLKLFAPDDQVEVKLSARAKKVKEALALSKAARAAG